MKKTLFVILLAAFLVIPNAFSQETQSGYSNSITFYTSPSIVQSYAEFIAQQQAAPSTTQTSQAGQQVVGSSAAYSSSATGNFVKCAENALRNSNPALGREIDQVISSKASGKVDACLLCGLIQQESSFQTDVISSANCRGLTQLSKGVYESCGMDSTSVFSVERNIDCGARYLSGRIMDYDGSVERGLAAYYCGNCARKTPLSSTAQNYVSAVLSKAQRFKQNGLC